MTTRSSKTSSKAGNISIVSRLKKIALTSLDLGREIAKDKAGHALGDLRASRAGQLFENTRQRLEHRLGLQKAAGKKRKPASAGQHHLPVQEEYSFSKKRRLGKDKYASKTSRLSHA